MNNMSWGVYLVETAKVNHAEPAVVATYQRSALPWTRLGFLLADMHSHVKNEDIRLEPPR